jgi:hypothetical protein
MLDTDTRDFISIGFILWAFAYVSSTEVVPSLSLEEPSDKLITWLLYPISISRNESKKEIAFVLWQPQHDRYEPSTSALWEIKFRSEEKRECL